MVEVAFGRNLALNAQGLALHGTIAAYSSDAEDIASCLGAGVLRPRVGARFPLERIAEAHEAVEGGRAGGRVVVEVG